MTDHNESLGIQAVDAPEGHNEKMLAAFEKSQSFQQDGQASPSDPKAPSDRPEWVPEKFWKDGKADYEGLAKSYSELEKRLGKPAEAPKATEEAKAPEADKAAEDAVKAAGLDINDLYTKYSSDGQIEDSDYAALEKAGIPRAMVDQYIAGTEALKEVQRVSIFEEVGGKANYESAVRWAASTLSKDEITAYNRIVDTGSMEEKKLAAAGLYSRYTKSEGSRPALLSGNNTPAQGDVFRSTAELTRAMADPRYNTDPAYREDVASKLYRSNISF
jgi:hypothetical protein